MKNGLFCVLISLVMVSTAGASVTVFDFENDSEIPTWRIRSPGEVGLERSPRYATSGQWSMVFTTPAWKGRMHQWRPVFEVKPPVTDWSPYDRVVVDITNPNSERYFLSLLVSDSKVPVGKGLSYLFDLPVNGFRRFVIPLSSFPEAVDRSDIAVMHFRSQRSVTDMRLYLDNIVLLKKGERAPELSPEFVKQVVSLLLGSLDGYVAEWQVLKKLCEAAKRQQADAEIASVTARIQAMRDEAQSQSVTLERLSELGEELAQLRLASEGFVSTMRLHMAYAKLGIPQSGMVVGFASSMEKILPRVRPDELLFARNIEMSLARNEKESFQIAVLPDTEALRKVSVSVGDLTSADGDIFKAENIDCDVVGYVETIKSPTPASHAGWWPDPILDFLGPVDIAEGDMQTFWIRIRATKHQAAGIYRGAIKVSAEGIPTLMFGLTVTVHSFVLPDHTPLPTAITFFEHKAQMGGEENWHRMKFEYADFLADYYIDYDNLYRETTPDYEIIERLHGQGRLVAFNLGNVLNAGAEAEGFDKAIGETVERIRPAYEKAKQLGLLDYAYIYGFDERNENQFAFLERAAQALKKAYPEVLLMTTSFDHSYGLNSIVKTIDAWCPRTDKYDMKKAAEARAQGKKVWWYICLGPKNPFANWFVGYAAIEARLLMGAMTAKYRPDGFLYYSLTYWNKNKPIEKGPFTNWDPVSFGGLHGDGSLLCSGPGGKPVPTIRLENYRDGMEDFAYVCILEAIVRKYEAGQEALSPQKKQWLDEARAALLVPETLVKTMKEYSRAPKEVYAYRNRLAELIDRSGMHDVDPWGPNFNVRGFPVR